jgi:hypothetical protein
MNPRLVAALQNNACWCDIVCRSHGVPTVRSEQLWIAPEGSPLLYPDAVTLAPQLAADSVLRRIDTSPGCSVKDSFADLDPLPYGFTVLFDALWLFRDRRRRGHVRDLAGTRSRAKPTSSDGPSRLVWKGSFVLSFYATERSMFSPCSTSTL